MFRLKLIFVEILHPSTSSVVSRVRAVCANIENFPLKVDISRILPEINLEMQTSFVLLFEFIHFVGEKNVWTRRQKRDEREEREQQVTQGGDRSTCALVNRGEKRADV